MTVKKRLATAAAVTCLALSGCYSAPIMPPIGVLFSNIEAPTQATGEFGSRRGRSSCTAILGLVAWGDCSLQAAANAGGITTVKHTDYSFTNVIVGIYQSYTTVAYGD